MSARDVMLNAGLPHYDEGGCIGLDEFERREVVESIIDAAISALTASGYRILGPDELDTVTVEKCAAEVEAKANSYADPKEVSLWECAKPISVRLYGAATAIRAICAAHQGAKSE